MAEDHIEIFSALNTQEAYFVRNLLADAGINALVVGEGLRNAVGELPPLTTNPRVWVTPSDADRARPIVQEYERRNRQRVAGKDRGVEFKQSDHVTEPFCYHCGNPVNRGQSPCPSCGQPLEWDRAQD